MNKHLHGRGVVVTRPAHQAAYLAGLIQEAGGYPILFPTMEIVELEDTTILDGLIDRLEQFDIAVFVSPNAVGCAMKRIMARRAWPPALHAAAIGAGGVRRLREHGLAKVIAPRRFDSEALLNLAPMRNVQGRRIVIFRGVGGRELLGNTLRERGAEIEYAECYRRRMPDADASSLREACARGDVHALTATSSEGLRNLVQLAGKDYLQWLARLPLFVTHPRIEATARTLRFSTIIMTGQGDDNLVPAAVRWFSGVQWERAVYSTGATD